MSHQETTATTVEVEQLRPLLQEFNEGLGRYINNIERHKLGRVLTIVDASIADPEQRKAIKDLVNGMWWNDGLPLLSANDMYNPHTDLRAICRVLEFELYPEASPSDGPIGLKNTIEDETTYIEKRYKSAASNRKSQ